MNNKHEIDFYKKLAEEVKPQWFKCFLYNENTSAWLYIITPNNSWLYIDEAYLGGYNIVYNYSPSKDFGSGCGYNDKPLYEITSDTLYKAEQYGKNYGYHGWKNVPNRYDGKTHRENVWRKPEHYKDAYSAMMSSWCADKLVEL